MKHRHLPHGLSHAHLVEQINKEVAKMSRANTRTKAFIAFMFVLVLGGIGAAAVILTNNKIDPTPTPPPPPPPPPPGDQTAIDNAVEEGFGDLFLKAFDQYGYWLLFIFVGLGLFYWGIRTIRKYLTGIPDIGGSGPAGTAIIAGVTVASLSSFFGSSLGVVTGVALTASGVVLGLAQLTSADETNKDRSERWKERLEGQKQAAIDKIEQQIEELKYLKREQNRAERQATNDNINTLQIEIQRIKEPISATMSTQEAWEFTVLNKQIDAKESKGLFGYIRSLYWGDPPTHPFVEKPQLPWFARITQSFVVDSTDLVKTVIDHHRPTTTTENDLSQEQVRTRELVRE
ncbi:MAG: hypothetical protein K0U52_10075 [Gammaproteobacteria bacterium]|nr:hypothetical protein [Gammaproteobacteria bacterium]